VAQAVAQTGYIGHVRRRCHSQREALDCARIRLSTPATILLRTSHRPATDSSPQLQEDLPIATRGKDADYRRRRAPILDASGSCRRQHRSWRSEKIGRPSEQSSQIAFAHSRNFTLLRRKNLPIASRDGSARIFTTAAAFISHGRFRSNRNRHQTCTPVSPREGGQKDR